MTNTKQMKRCRVCGDPIDHHPLAYRECMVKAYELPLDWPATYEAYLLLCLKNNYMDAYGQDASGLRTLRFGHREEIIITKDPATEMAKIILTELAPVKDREVTLEPRNITESIAKQELQDIVEETPPKEDKGKKWWELGKEE